MTLAISALDSPAWNLRAMSSRSRGSSEASAARTVARRSAPSSSGSATASSGGSVTSAAVRDRRRSSASAALRAMSNSQARSLPRARSKLRRLRSARSKASAVTSSAAARSRSSEATYAYTSAPQERYSASNDEAASCLAGSAMVAVPMPVLRTPWAFITGGAIFVCMPLRRTTLGVILLALGAPSGALAASAPWATVNVCDTAANPDTVGVRGSMPGNGVASQEMFMRFQLQYQRDDGRWRQLGATGDSGFIDVGRSKTRGSRQAG